MPSPAHIKVEARSFEQIRADFPLLQKQSHGRQLAFLDSAASSQKPESVILAIDDYYRNKHANVHRGVYELSQEATNAFEAAREAVRLFINAASESEVIFTRGTTESINIVASGFGRSELKPGDEVLITEMEHHSNIVPWQMACERSGASLRVLPVDDSGQLKYEELDNLLTEKTRMLAFNHISNSLGTVNDVKRIIHKAREMGTAVLIDGAQAAPHTAIDVQELDADFYAFSAHKMYGPTGIGVLYGKRQWLDRLPPFQGGGEMIERVTFEKTTYNVPPFKFEAGTPNIAGAIGLHAAVEYIQQIGHKRIAQREAKLLRYATQKLSTIKGMRFVGTAPEKAPVLSFLVDGQHPYDIGSILDQMGVAVRTGHHCTQPLMDRFGIPGTVRASFGIYNNEEDADRLYNGVEKAVKMLG